MHPSFVAVLLALPLSGCGLRGPLYLPEDRPASTTPQARPATTEEAARTIEPRPAPQAQKREGTAGAATGGSAPTE